MSGGRVPADPPAKNIWCDAKDHARPCKYLEQNTFSKRGVQLEYGLLASADRQRNIAQARQVLGVPAPVPQVENVDGAERASKRLAPACPCGGGRMVIIETFQRGGTPRYHSTVPTRIVRIDTS